MNGHEFKRIRLGLLLTQQELSDLLGYRHKIRISEYERETNPVPIPAHIEKLMLDLAATSGRSVGNGLTVGRSRLIRSWEPKAA